MTIADLAPGDQKSASLDLSQFEVIRISGPDDPWFDVAYGELEREFGALDELETKEVLRRRLGRPAGDAMIYEMVLMRFRGEIAAIRDHTVVQTERTAVVHLSHAFVVPAWRRTGLAGWLRAWPVERARSLAKPAITLVAEMEHPSSESPERMPRLRAYEKAGFLKIDPAALPYFQPDFRAPEAIDRDGVRPLPFALIIRRTGRETEPALPGSEVRQIVESLYAMYGREFRSQDMTAVQPVLAALSRLPPEVALIPPTA